ncbi:polyribonucleotide nucleotidyltransferase [Patescibacteria group bacterium]|nr:polyribonucleotide nucleotidyltransferase [Patescibacteria group bacterium]MBU1016291.1 polyribonucleotide nucleotidyltransferase [Patescibacteria group bacterium]MBU1685567.1 polyribonucleotide nucleotidyltransferase [Patescibacteria group bacterium]MBU1938492.1 polyribonucleotide nucleotidyltransferase [Patescibacteria group bacterium]
MEPKTFTLPLGNKEFVVEVGKMAQLANGSCTVRYGDTVILATATMSNEAREGVNFLPLMVNYQEKMYASGVIKSSRFIKRETRPSDDKILMARVADRTYRPLFPKGFHRDIQVMLTTLSYDRENEHDMIATIAGSVALSISDIPFEGPTATVRVGLIEGELVLNPTAEARTKSDLDLIVSSDTNHVIMIEAGANEVTEEKMLEAIDFGKKWGQKIVRFIQDIQKEVGIEKLEFTTPEKNPIIVDHVSKYADKVLDALFHKTGKLDRYNYFREIAKEVKEALEDQLDENELKQIGEVVDKLVKDTVRKNILENDKRIGGRKMDEIRPLSVEAGFLPRTHGSALFNRGETQGLTTCTLGAPGDAQIIDGIEGESKKSYFHHYNFPPFSVGETSNRLFTGNREVGHGSLAERALMPVLPKKEDFPYTIRTVTEILASNGSSSMAATCGSSLALMDAGVPIKKAVGGVAMGLMTDHENPEKYRILTDLQDEEDMGGDMDFKVTGTRDGITAIQMDIKLKGLPHHIFEEALESARKGRLHILDAMDKVISAPRPELSPFAPRLLSMQVNPEKIRFIIGPGGEMINRIIAETGVQSIDIEDDGSVVITSVNGESAKKAEEWVKQLTADPEVGKIYENSKVTKVLEFGAIVEFMPGKEGMVHVSEITDSFVKDVASVIKEGQIVNVKLLAIDVAQGRFKLTMKGIPQPKA